MSVIILRIISWVFSLNACALLGIEWLRSLEAGAYEFFSPGDAWRLMAPSGPEAVAEILPGWLWDPVLIFLLAVPAWIYPMFIAIWATRRLRWRLRRRRMVGRR